MFEGGAVDEMIIILENSVCRRLIPSYAFFHDPGNRIELASVSRNLCGSHYLIFSFGRWSSVR